MSGRLKPNSMERPCLFLYGTWLTAIISSLNSRNVTQSSGGTEACPATFAGWAGCCWMREAVRGQASVVRGKTSVVSWKKSVVSRQWSVVSCVRMQDVACGFHRARGAKAEGSINHRGHRGSRRSQRRKRRKRNSHKRAQRTQRKSL